VRFQDQTPENPEPKPQELPLGIETIERRSPCGHWGIVFLSADPQAVNEKMMELMGEVDTEELRRGKLVFTRAELRLLNRMLIDEEMRLRAKGIVHTENALTVFGLAQKIARMMAAEQPPLGT
jgi:hypothetical protein